VEERNNPPNHQPNDDPCPAAPLARLLPRPVRVVVAVIDEGVGDGMAVIGVEALEQGLGNFLLLEPDLVEEGVGLVAAQRAQVKSLEIDPLEVLELLQLIGTDRGLVGPPVGDVEGLVDHVGSEPFLGGRRDAGMPRGDTAMSPVELGVGESGSGNAHGGTGSIAPDGVAGSRSAEAEGGAFRADVPAETGEEFIFGIGRSPWESGIDQAGDYATVWVVSQALREQKGNRVSMAGKSFLVCHLFGLRFEKS